MTGPNINFKTRIDRMDSVAKNGVITTDDLNCNVSNLIKNEDDVNNDLLHVITLSYIVDGIAGIKNPLGMHTEDLQVNNYLISGDKQQVAKIHQLIKINSERKKTQILIAELRLELQNLENEKQNLKYNDEYLMKLAREKYGMVMPGEKMFRVIEEDTEE